MYEKVQKHWAAYLEDLKARARKAKRGERKALRERIAFMKATDMAVVISQEQGEVKKFKEHGLDIRRHRKRVVKEDLDENFKDPENPLRLAFVCAMWRTGFDAPPCSTIYLDRPMRNHTLMQTIARANRVFGQKVNGLIVDYVGIFRELQQALAIYGTGTGGGIEAGDSPVQHKDALVERLEEAIAAAEAFCTARGVDIYSIVQSEGFQRIALMNGAVENLVEPRVEASLDDAVEKIILNDDLKAEYLSLAGEVDRLFRAILPDTRAADFAPRRRVFVVLAKKIRNLTGEPDISGVMALVGGLLDKSVSARGYKIPEPSVPYDLSQIDFEALREQFDKGRKRTQAQRLRRTIEVKLERMVRSNPTRTDYLAEFKRLIDEYNMGARNVEELFKSLVDFAQRLSEEEQRTIAEKLSEEELAIFDILTRPGPDLSEKERKEVKAIASELLETLKSERLVLDWRKRQQSRAAVQVAIRDLIYRLPKCFSEALCKTKSAALYQHVYSSYFGAGQSVYAAADAVLA
jgi:type I restriction enzyme R subunit